MVTTSSPKSPSPSPSRPRPSRRQRTAEAVAEQAGLPADEAAVLIDLVTDAEASRVAETVTTSLPVDAAGLITVDAPASQGHEVAIGLPTGSEHRDAQVAEDGTVVFEDRSGVVDVTAQPLADGSVRVQTVLLSADAPTEYGYSLTLPADVSPRITAAGGVDMVREVSVVDDVTGETPTEVVTVSSVAPAWASRRTRGGTPPTRSPSVRPP